MDDPHLDSERASPPESSPGNRFRGPIGMSEPQGPGQRRTAVVILIGGILQTVFGVLLITPFIRQRWRIGRHLRRFGPPNPPSEDLTSSTITIVVAARGGEGHRREIVGPRSPSALWTSMEPATDRPGLAMPRSRLPRHGSPNMGTASMHGTCRCSPEIGKTDSLRRVLPSIEGDLILLTDADARFQSGSIERASFDGSLIPMSVRSAGRLIAGRARTSIPASMPRNERTEICSRSNVLPSHPWEAPPSSKGACSCSVWEPSTHWSSTRMSMPMMPRSPS